MSSPELDSSSSWSTISSSDSEYLLEELLEDNNYYGFNGEQEPVAGDSGESGEDEFFYYLGQDLLGDESDDSEDSDMGRLFGMRSASSMDLQSLYLELYKSDESTDDEEDFMLPYFYPKENCNHIIFSMIVQNQFIKFKNLIKDQRSLLKIQDRDGRSLLHVCLIKRRRKFFDYLLTCEDYDLNLHNFCTDDTALMYAAKIPSTYYVSKLAKSGCSVNFLNSKGNTALHYAALNKNSQVGQILIDSGAKIDSQNQFGNTPLHVACSKDNLETVSMLIINNANLFLPNFMRYRETPFDVALRKKHEDVVEILYEFMFDNLKSQVRLHTLVTALNLKNEAFFARLIETVSDVTVTNTELRYLFANLMTVEFESLALFIRKFPAVFESLLDKFRSLNDFYDLLKTRNFDMVDPAVVYKHEFHDFLCKFLEILLESGVIDNLDGLRIEIHSVYNFLPEQSIKWTLFLLSHGVELGRNVLEDVFQRFGLSTFFRTLLHMDINLRQKFMDEKPRLYPSLMYDPYLTIQTFLGNPTEFSKDNFATVLRFFAHPKWRQFCINQSSNDELRGLAARLPQVPKLLELAREAARAAVIQVFEVKNSRQFLTAVKTLPVPREVREYLTYERPLYTSCLLDQE